MEANIGIAATSREVPFSESGQIHQKPVAENPVYQDLGRAERFLGPNKV
jgi:hypothetical protein